MSRLLRPLRAGILAALLPSSGFPENASPHAYRQAFDQRLEAAAARHANAAQDALRRYAAELTALRGVLQQKGSLEGVLALRNEEQRLVQRRTLTTNDLSAASAELRSCQEANLVRLQALETERAREIVKLATDFAAALEKLKRSLTMASCVPEAIAARDEAARLDALPAVVEARARLAALQSESRAPPPEDAGGTQPPDALRRSLALYLTFDDPTGAVTDGSGKGHAPAVKQGATWTPDGRRGGAFRFDGERAHLEVPFSELLNFDMSDAFTIALWVKLEPKGNRDRPDHTLLGTWDRVYDPGPEWRGYRLQTVAGQGGVALFQIRHQSTFQRSVRGSTPLVDGHWHHVAVVHYGKSRRSKEWKPDLYVDGKLEACVYDSDGRTPGSARTGFPLRIGVDRDTFYSYGAKGWIDEVMVFHGALSPLSVGQVYGVCAR